MPAAPRATYCRWVVKALTALGPSAPRAVYDWIRRNESVPAADLFGLTGDGENLFEKEVRFARWQLRQEGTVVSPERGVWALKSNPGVRDRNYA
jgi:hypothetical protein